MQEYQFQEFPKIARLNRDCVITEMIDGTNAQVYISQPGVLVPVDHVLGESIDGYLMLAGSRNRYLVAGKSDNFGFAAWVSENQDFLWALGPGHHYGEWWGSGVQRGYGLRKGEKRFSLFNTARWVESWRGPNSDGVAYRAGLEPKQQYAPECCNVVPVLWKGPFDTDAVRGACEGLASTGSIASPGFMDPEGVVVFHEAAGQLFKVTLKGDEKPKGRAA